MCSQALPASEAPGATGAADPITDEGVTYDFMHYPIKLCRSIPKHNIETFFPTASILPIISLHRT